MRNVVQYASGFAAIGCSLEYDTTTGEMSIYDVPRSVRKSVDDALLEIECFENTANHEDGIAIFAIADKINGQDNPFLPVWRSGILCNILGYTDPSGKFYRSVIHSIKVQRAWHSSLRPNECTYFEHLCTHRGVTNQEGKRGRKSERGPDEYHRASSRGIAREQLVTPALAEMYNAIPDERLVTKTTTKVISINLEEAFKNLTPEQAVEWIKKLESLKS